ncbi:MAG TPA: hypothetical protein VIU87_21315 [Mycobacterium sp.]
MNRGGFAVVSGLLVLTCLTACSATVAGTATWPGATLERVLLTEQDFPAGVHYDRLTDDSTQPDGAGGPPPMISQPPGCANALTNVIAKSAERGPGSALSYSVSFDGARVVMTALSWQLDLEGLAATAGRCERFEAFFDSQSDGIPMTTTRLPADDGSLMYQQTMELAGVQNSIYMAFANVGPKAVFGIVFPTENPTIPVKATLPQTFTDIVGRQIARIRAG